MNSNDILVYIIVGYGGGAGYGTKGLSQYDNIYGGPTYGTNTLDKLYLGSGGGCDLIYNGGSGGGALKIEANNIIINDTAGIYCNGSYNGYNGGCGSGGSIYIISKSLDNKGTIQSIGGQYGFKGGNGRIRIDCNKIIHNANIDPKPFYGM